MCVYYNMYYQYLFIDKTLIKHIDTLIVIKNTYYYLVCILVIHIDNTY